MLNSSLFWFYCFVVGVSSVVFGFICIVWDEFRFCMVVINEVLVEMEVVEKVVEWGEEGVIVCFVIV